MIVSFAFIFLLSLSIVSAGITGYLVTRGGGIAEAGTTATLQGVRDGVATIAVTTKAGDTQVVRVREGETAQVGAATISASSLTRGTLFTRGKANVEINVESASETGVGAIAGEVATMGILQKHTHLIDYPYKRSATFSRSTSRIFTNLSCLNNSVIVDTGFKLNFNGTMLNKQNNMPNFRLPIMEYSYHDPNNYYLGFLDYYEVILPSSSVYVYCAEIEKAVNGQTAHFPY